MQTCSLIRRPGEELITTLTPSRLALYICATKIEPKGSLPSAPGLTWQYRLRTGESPGLDSGSEQGLDSWRRLIVGLLESLSFYLLPGHHLPGRWQNQE